LKPDEPLFDVSAALVKILDRDLNAAGIPKRDDRGRTLDVHALRTTFGTHLSKAGVSLRTAQAAMRHSTPTLTANIYTDPRLLDVHGAVEALPMLSLTETRPDDSERLQATGTDPSLTLLLTLASGKTGQTGSSVVTFGSRDAGRVAGGSDVESGENTNEKALSALKTDRAGEVEAKGVEPSTSALRTRRPQQESPRKRLDSEAGPAAYTAAYTRPTENAFRTEAEGASGTARKRAAGKSQKAPPQSETEAGATGSTGTKPTDFAAAVASIMALPLTDAEKAECIRRLLGKSGE